MAPLLRLLRVETAMVGTVEREKKIDDISPRGMETYRSSKGNNKNAVISLKGKY